MTVAAHTDSATGIAVGAPPSTRHGWTRHQIQALFERPFMDLLFAAQSVHRAYFDPNAVQVSILLSTKTGACRSWGP